MYVHIQSCTSISTTFLHDICPSDILHFHDIRAANVSNLGWTLICNKGNQAEGKTDHKDKKRKICGAKAKFYDF